MKRREYRKSPFKQFFRELPGSTRFAILTIAREPKTIPELLEEMDRANRRFGVEEEGEVHILLWKKEEILEMSHNVD